MASELRDCPDCGHKVSARANRCPNCGGPLWRKTAKEAYSWNGMGILDLIPGIRDLPDSVRLVLMIIGVALLLFVYLK